METESPMMMTLGRVVEGGVSAPGVQTCGAPFVMRPGGGSCAAAKHAAPRSCLARNY